MDAALDGETRKSPIWRAVARWCRGAASAAWAIWKKAAQQLLTVRKKLSQAKYPRRPNAFRLYKVKTTQLKRSKLDDDPYTASEDCIVGFYTDGYETASNSSTYGTLNSQRSCARHSGRNAGAIHRFRGSDPIFRRSSRMSGTPCSSVRIRMEYPVVSRNLSDAAHWLLDDYVIPCSGGFLHPNPEATFCCACMCRKVSSPCSTSAHAALLSAIL